MKNKIADKPVSVEGKLQATEKSWIFALFSGLLKTKSSLHLTEESSIAWRRRRSQKCQKPNFQVKIPVQYLNGHIRSGKWHNKTEVCPVLHVAVLLGQIGCHEAFSNRSSEAVAWGPIFHKDVEVLIVTATSDRGWDCRGFNTSV